jgi:hypothetical protein
MYHDRTIAIVFSLSSATMRSMAVARTSFMTKLDEVPQVDGGGLFATVDLEAGRRVAMGYGYDVAEVSGQVSG